MLRLDTINRTIQLHLGTIVTTNQLPIVVCYSDKTGLQYTGASQLSLSNGTTPVIICNSPAASTVRDIDSISIYNADTVPAAVSVVYNAAGTLYPIGLSVLDPGDSLRYTHSSGWATVNNTGSVKMGIANATLLLGQTWANPGPIGGSIPNVATFTTATATTFSGTLNGNASSSSNISGTPLLPNGVTTPNQLATDNSSKLANTHYVDAAITVSGLITSGGGNAFQFNVAPTYSIVHDGGVSIGGGTVLGNMLSNSTPTSTINGGTSNG